jgi:hypothetical protein
MIRTGRTRRAWAIISRTLHVAAMKNSRTPVPLIVIVFSKLWPHARLFCRRRRCWSCRAHHRWVHGGRHNAVSCQLLCCHACMSAISTTPAANQECAQPLLVLVNYTCMMQRRRAKLLLSVRVRAGRGGGRRRRGRAEAVAFRSPVKHKPAPAARLLHAAPMAYPSFPFPEH